MEPESLTTDEGDSKIFTQTSEGAKNCSTGEKIEQEPGAEDSSSTGNKLHNKDMEVQSGEAVVQEPLVPDVTRFSYDVQHGYRIFCELLADQYKSVTYPFIEPVDVEGLGLLDYYTRIETPMSFKQIESKFKNYLYQSITEIVSDMRLILENCYRYNGPDHCLSKLALKLEKILDQKLALLNRSLREKVTLQATMAFRNNKEIVPEDEEPGGRRRRSGRSTQLGGMHGDQSSRLVSYLILEKEETERELRKLKEKEKREANEALMQELGGWEKEIFTPDVLKQLQSMWEIPSVGSFLWLFREALNLPELNYGEFEHGLVLPHKSHQMARIFSALLFSPSKRKRLLKNSPLPFSSWQKQLKIRMDLWYQSRNADELRLVAHQVGLDDTFFEIIGDTNPLEKGSYLDLTLHQRVLILKVLCDECLEYEPQLRDCLGSVETSLFREVLLGYDGENCSYLYFPLFDVTDIRIYKQSSLPQMTDWYRRWRTSSKCVSGCATSGRVSHSRSRKSETERFASTSRRLGSTIEEGFELVCYDVETLRVLCEKFADRTTTPAKGRRGRPTTRKRSEKELHDALSSLVEDLTKFEAKYVKSRNKGMVNLMKDWKKEEEEAVESGDDSVAGSEHSAPKEEHAITEPLVVTEADATVSLHWTEERPESESVSVSLALNSTSEEHDSHDNSNPLSQIVTRSRNRKRPLGWCEDFSPVSAAPSVQTLVGTEHEVDSDIGLSVDNKDSCGVEELGTESMSPADNPILKKDEIGNHEDLACPVGQPSNGANSLGSLEGTKYGESREGATVASGNYGEYEDGKNSENRALDGDITMDGNGMRDDDSRWRSHGDIDNGDHSETNGDNGRGRPHAKVLTDSNVTCETAGSLMDITGKKDAEEDAVYKNGDCDNFGACNGISCEESYEPASKRYCSADSFNTPGVSEESELTTEIENKFLKTSHQSPVMAPLGSDAQTHVTALVNPVKGQA